MTPCRWLILALWLGFVAYWGIAAIGVKRNVGARAWRREAGIRIVVVVLVLLAVRVPVLRHALGGLGLSRAPAAGVAGVVLCGLGFGLAVWARVCLGRNWGMPMSRKEDPELVTAGPYAFVRHPIYAGLLLAMLGTAVGTSLAWLVLLVVFGAYFIHSARREEALMLAQFPAAYAAYMQRTRMLIPFVL
jgi:protein-S-isoprenylcysteine O-methyltransferase Ste14